MHGRKILHYYNYSKYRLQEKDSLCASKMYNRRKGPKGCFCHKWEDTPAGRCYRDFLHSPPNSVAIFFLYLLDSDWLTSLLFYSQSFLGLSSSCQLFPFSFIFSLLNSSSSCFLRLYSFLLPFLVTSFTFLRVVLLFLVSYQVKFALTQGHSQNLEYFF